MRIIGYKTSQIDGKTMLEESTGAHTLSADLNNLLGFLCEPYEDTIRVTWNLNAFASLLLKYLSLHELETLRETHKLHRPPFNLFYIPSKVFTVTHISSKTVVTFYDLEQYYPSLPEPDTLDYLQFLGEYLLGELKKMHLTPTKLTSPIAIYDECIMSKLDLPQAKDMPVEASEMAYRCSARHWIEAHQIGYFPETFDYDMISAFPAVMKHLVDFRDCHWLHSANYQPNAVYGYTYCHATINPDVMLSPILHETEEFLISPTGRFPEYLTKHQLDFVMKHDIGSAVIRDGWWAIPKKGVTLKKPFYSIMNELLKHKDITQLQTLLTKRMSTGIWGKLGEELKDSFGKHFNPCWFAETSTQVSLLLAEFLYAYKFHTEHYNTLLHLSLDGFKTTKEIKLPPKNQKWRLAHRGEVLIVSSGLCYTRKTKPRGLTLADILDLIFKQRNQAYYTKPLTRLATMNDSITARKPSLLGSPVSFQSSVDLTHPEHDRHFPKLPEVGNDLLTKTFPSIPIKLEME